MTGEDWVFDAEPTVPNPTVSHHLNFSQPDTPHWMIVIPSEFPHKFMLHFNGQEVGTLDISSGVLKFEGAMDDSAAALFLAFKSKVDAYIEDHMLE